MICKYISSDATSEALEWWDAHNHLQDAELAYWGEAMWEEVAKVGVRGGMVNGTCPADWEQVRAVVQAGYPGIWQASYGVHPWRVMDLPKDWLEDLEGFLDGGHAVGEIGLDRWVEGVDFSVQQQIFSQQWELAARSGVPVTVHCLRAWRELRDFIEQAPVVSAFLLHAYGGPAEQVEWWVQRGAYFSFSGTFLDRPKKMAAFLRVPRERLLVETDAPSMRPAAKYCYLPSWASEEPQDHAPHHPASLPACGAALAAFLGCSAEELSRQTAKNYFRLFGVDRDLARDQKAGC